MDTDQLDDPDLPGLVSAAMEVRDQGLEPNLAEICAARPDLIEVVELSLQTSQRLNALQRSSAGHDRWTGRVLAERYRLDARLGAGAMGVVYRGEDLELQRPVAVKILRAALVDSGEAEYRFGREAEAMAAIRHGSVINVFDRGRTDEEDPFLVMELLEGRSLSELLEAGEIAGDSTHTLESDWIARELGVEALDEPSYIRTAVTWASELANGLVATHDKGIFHRDVKPSNVFIRTDGAPVLLDFGIAARLDQQTITAEGTAVGTPAYMAPESLKADVKPGPQLDVYSLSATLYHLLTLRAPYTGSPSQIISRLVTSDPKPAVQVRPGLPRDLQAILDRGMARRPSERYASVADLEGDLRAFLEYRPVSARPIGPVTRAWRRARRSRAFWSVSALLLVAGLIAGAWSWTQRRIQQRGERYIAARAELPPNMVFLKPANRAHSEEQGRSRLESVLDSMVENRAEPLPALAYRACFRLDHGTVQGAIDDMRAIATELGTDYAKELAARYEALAPGSRSHADLALEDLPEPVLEEDLFLHLLHLIRSEDWPKIIPLTRDERVTSSILLEELRLPFMKGDAAGVYEVALNMENRAGRRTAISGNWIGVGLNNMGRFADAQPILEEALELAPNSPPLLRNLALSYWRQGRYALADHTYERLYTLRPGYFQAHQLHVECMLEAGELERANELIQRLAYPEDGGRVRKDLEGQLCAERALAYSRQGLVNEAREQALMARTLFLESVADGKSPKSMRYALANGIADSDSHLAFQALCSLALESPLSWRAIQVALDARPESMNNNDAAALFRLSSAINSALKDQFSSGAARSSGEEERTSPTDR